MIGTSIPEAIRICPGCHSLASGGDDEYCAQCLALAERYDSEYHACRAAELFGSLPRVMLRPPIDDGLGAFRATAVAMLFTACTVAAALLLALAVRWRW